MLTIMDFLLLFVRKQETKKKMTKLNFYVLGVESAYKFCWWGIQQWIHFSHGEFVINTME